MIHIFFILLISSFSLSAELSLEQFLEQVKSNHEGFKASEWGYQGASQRQHESQLLTLPQLNLTYQTGTDERNIQNPLYLSSGKMLLASITQQTTFGLNASLGYSWNYKETTAPASVPPVPTYYWSSPTIQISQSLWRNGFGSEVSAQKELLAASARASQNQELFKNKMILVEAKIAYQNLFYARKTVSALKESLDLADKLKSWSKKRADANLGDMTDFLQTKAAYELRELELSKAQMEEALAARYFNSLRNIDNDLVADTLIPPEIPDIKAVAGAKTKASREDVTAALESLKIAKSQSQLGKERNKPSLDVFASYSGYGLDLNQSSEAVKDSVKFEQPGYVVGVKFSTPLVFWKSADVRSGYGKEVLAADLYYSRKDRELQRDFNNLKIKLENVFKRYNLARSLENSQKDKLSNERRRYQKGRTTLFQVLQFEQDFVNAQLNTIRTENELNSLFSEFKLYNQGSEL